MSEKGLAITVAVLASPIATDNSITTAVFGFVGVLIGAVVAGGFTVVRPRHADALTLLP